MKKFCGYIRALKNYLQTDKGRHDFLDYLQAGFIILLTSFILGVVIWL